MFKSLSSINHQNPNLVSFLPELLVRTINDEKNPDTLSHLADVLLVHLNSGVFKLGLSQNNNRLIANKYPWEKITFLHDLSSEAGLYLIKNKLSKLSNPIAAYLVAILISRNPSVSPPSIIDAFMEHLDSPVRESIGQKLQAEPYSFWYLLFYISRIFEPPENYHSCHDMSETAMDQIWELNFYNALYQFWIANPERVLEKWDNFEQLIDPKMPIFIIDCFLHQSQTTLTINATSPLALGTLMTKLFSSLLREDYFDIPPVFHQVFEEVPEAFDQALEQRAEFYNWFFSSEQEKARELRDRIKDSKRFTPSVRDRFMKLNPSATEKHFPLEPSARNHGSNPTQAELVIQTGLLNTRKRSMSHMENSVKEDAQEPCYKKPHCS